MSKSRELERALESTYHRTSALHCESAAGPKQRRFAELSCTSANNVKLGSLQRWTRDPDACVDMTRRRRALLWLLCRVAAGSRRRRRRRAAAAFGRRAAARRGGGSGRLRDDREAAYACARRPQNARRRTNMI